MDEKLDPTMTITLPQSEIRLVKDVIKRHRFNSTTQEKEEMAIQAVIFAIWDEEKRIYDEVFK